MMIRLLAFITCMLPLNLSAQLHDETNRIQTPTKQREEARSEWGLTEAEWREYESIMRGKRGNWSPNLDPISALGVSTDSAEERRHFAELFVRAEFERVRKELAFQVAVDEAWKRLYPATPRFDREKAHASIVAAPERFALVLSDICVSCETFIADQLDDYLALASAGVDVHVVGTNGDDATLRAWASRHPAVTAALRDGRLTINHGDQFEDISQFPAVWRKAGGRWTRER